MWEDAFKKPMKIGIMNPLPFMNKMKIANPSHFSLTFVMAIFVWLAGAFFVYFSTVEAQGEAGLRISPSIIEDRIEPGDSFEGTLRVTNLEGTEREFFIIRRDISSIGPGGQPVFAEPGEITGYELSEWISLAQTSIVLNPNEEGTVNFVVTVPENASPGGHFGGIFLSAEAERQRTTGAGVGYQVGTIMNFRIGGDIIEEAQVREFSTDNLLYGTANVKFDVSVENEGNVLIRPRGPIDIADMFGKKVATIRLNDSGAAVLPNSRRDFSISWEDEGFFFGRYEAIVALAYGEDVRKTASAATSFWVLPIQIILPVLGGLLLFVLLIYFGMRMYVRRRLEDMYRHSRVRAKGRRPARVVRAERGPFPKIAVVVIALLVFTMLFLAVLFLFFA